MSASRIVLAFACALSLAACHRDRCLSVCQQRQKELRCQPRETCKATCDQLHEASPCAAEMRGWEDCIVSLPTHQWECNAVGQPVPQETACTEARGKVVTCISKFPQWPLPKK
jgi:hypothetical protein